MHQYSRTISQAIHRYLHDVGWGFSFEEDTGIFNFQLRLRTVSQYIGIMISVHDSYYIVHGLCSIKVDPRKIRLRRQVEEFLHRVNYHLKCGNFDINPDTGAVNFRVCTECAGIDAPSDDMICSNICCTIAMCERFLNGIADIADGLLDALAAFDVCMEKEIDFDSYFDY